MTTYVCSVLAKTVIHAPGPASPKRLSAVESSGAAQQPAAHERVGDGARAVVGVVLDARVAAAPAVGLADDPVGGDDRVAHLGRRRGGDHRGEPVRCDDRVRRRRDERRRRRDGRRRGRRRRRRGAGGVGARAQAARLLARDPAVDALAVGALVAADRDPRAAAEVAVDGRSESRSASASAAGRAPRARGRPGAGRGHRRRRPRVPEQAAPTVASAPATASVRAQARRQDRP